MKIVIATGIYPPEIGGPAFYAKNLSDTLLEGGHDVSVVTYGWIKKLPIGVRHILYLFKIFPRFFCSDVVIVLDTFSVALPVVLANIFFKIPVIVRAGGDFLWEQYVERSGDQTPLPVFYKEHKLFNSKEKFIFKLTKWMLGNVDRVVFSSDFLRDIWLPIYNLKEGQVYIIENANLGKIDSIPPTHKNFLWYSRDILLKNGARLKEAFELAKKQVPNIELEIGQVPQTELIKKIKSCYAVILPSISEVSPNYILDAVRCGKPFIQTKYSGYAERFNGCGLLCDPLSVEDMAKCIVDLCDDVRYKECVGSISRLDLSRSYIDIAEDFVEIITGIKQKRA